MRKRFVLPLVIVLLGGIGFIGFKAWGVYGTHVRLLLMENKIVNDPKQEVLAIYDPENKLKERPEHFRLQVNAQSDWQLVKNELDKVPKDSTIILTVEVWGRRALDSIYQGDYNKKIEKLLSPLADRQNLFIRFNPEMEIPNSENTWSNWGGTHVKAFQQFSKIVKTTLPEAVMVWGPAGSMGNMEYFPGNVFFEAASISLDKEDETDLFLVDRPISAVLERKLHRMRFLEVPVIVFGSSEDYAENKKLFSNAFKWYNTAKKITNTNDLSNEQVKRIGPPALGVYDPKEELVSNESVSMEHIFISFETIKNCIFKKQFLEILSRNHDVIITMEPHSTGREEVNILKDILSGKYDVLLKDFFETIPENGPKVYLRFAHEMEIPVDRYPWQLKDPLLYIKTFRYFMQFPGSNKENIFKVWAPAGDRGSEDWWPGSDVVDFISMSIYGLPDKNITDFEKQESFEKIYSRKKNRLDLFGKPFLIAEFGVKGEEEYQQRWLLNAADIINNNKEIFGISYFNNEDVPQAWGEIQPPDWSLNRNVFSAFVNSIKL